MSDAACHQLNPGRLEIAYARLRAAVEAKDLPVGLLAVATSRETVRCEGYGPAGRIGDDGIYLLASITKPVVGTAIMQLVEEGRLLVDDPVVRYIPEFAVNGKSGVKVWHLMTHTSGLDEGYQSEQPSADQRPPDVPLDELDLRRAIGTYLKFPPGSRWEYCNVGFRILGELIRRLAGKPYQEYLQERVFTPAGMVDSTFTPAPTQLGRVLPVADMPKEFGDDPLRTFVAFQTPAGGLFSTAADLVALGQAYLNGGKGKRGRILGPAAIRLMTSVQTDGISVYDQGVPYPIRWGLTWSKTQPRDGLLFSPETYEHGGATGTQLWIDPARDLVVVFLTNRWGSDGHAKRLIANAVLGALE